ncbi:MAG: hypothetical protein HRT69_10580 [Flavobacteriaceae bacterium]|nr:hypothetical protein [Flavobacteriaceae bacterium]
MKKALKLTTIVLLLIFSISCERDDSELNIEPTIESTIEQKKNITDSDLNYKVIATTCDILGSSIACPNQTLTYIYTSNSSYSNVTWSYSTGITIISGQGTNTATFNFNPGFTTGYIQAQGQGFEVCSETIYLSCGNDDDDDDDDCGSINGITQLNVLGNGFVKFFIPNGSLIVNSGWSNPTYYWEFVCHSTGYTVSSNDVQPYVDLSNCTGFWDITVTVTVTNAQGVQCSFSRTEDYHPGGTGGF